MNNNVVYVEQDLIDDVKKFCEQEAIKILIQPIDKTSQNVITIRRDTACRVHDCDLQTIYVKGYISCAHARAMANKMNLSVNKMGKLLNFLNVKVKHCGLGCF